jgi:hypothetical protein
MTDPRRVLLALVTSLALAGAPAFAQSEWDGVGRIVVIGDLEGDDVKFEAMLADAGLTDADGDWIGGDAHLVQLGDIPDRGPNSRRIMDRLMELERQARRAGGRVHALVGNHEAMNVEGDLRYVDPGEYAAFVDRRSERRREQYWDQTVAYLSANPPPEGVPTFDDAYRAQWEERVPLGYVEHRIAWQPGGDYGDWVAGHDTVIRIDDTLFLHAGVGPIFLQSDRDAMNEGVRAALEGEPNTRFPDILVNEQGPLWYRGLALNAEETERAHLEALLAKHGVARIVTGHTKLASTVFPRFGGRVVIADIAVPEGYVDPYAYLIIENGVLTTVHRGARVPIQAETPEAVCAYVTEIRALDVAASATGAQLPGCPAP